MKRRTGFLAVMTALAVAAAGILLFSGCSASAAQASSEEDIKMESGVYRGVVADVTEEGSILVEQLDGHDYGQESILFHVADDTELDTEAAIVDVGAYVEVKYNGILTRSLPPQGTAQSVRVISSFSEGIVQNGVVQEVSKTDDGYTVRILPFGEEELPDGDLSNQVILLVPSGALEGLTEADLVMGMEVSAVTKGIAALSLPPQVPVEVLLPYTPR